MEKLDSITQGAAEIAQSEALLRKNTQLSIYHFLYGLIKHPRSISSKHLKSELNPVMQQLDLLPTVSNITLEQISFDPRLKEWFTLASSTSMEKGREQLTEADFLKHLSRFYKNIKLDADLTNDEASAPDFLENLNELASKGKLDPVIGRSAEIRKVMEILCRRTKNNPVLVGMAGVGKTAIVEGLAGLIVKNQVPEIIQGRTIYSLQMGSLMSGTKYRGEFEEKIVALLDFFKSNGRDALLFIDEIHLLIGAGRTDGAMDAANLLKPALARGELNCIGATTLEEYKKYIESDSALERRFHKVAVDAPDVSETIQILTGLKEKLEIHHGIEITNEAIVAAAELSNQYITDRNLPDKAIDLVDEASATLKLNADSPPAEVTELESQIASKKIIASASADDTNLQNEINDLTKILEEKKAVWDKSVLELRQAAELKMKLDQAQFDFEKKSAEGDYEEASRIKFTVIRDLTEKLGSLQISWKLTKNDIAMAVHNATGIPLTKILSNREDHLLHLYEYLTTYILGQNAAMKEIADSLIASHAGLTAEDRTLGSFLLLGPSGVGKTETAKRLANYLFNDETSLVRLDLSEYRESHSVSKLIGSPPGYIGSDKGGVLTERIRRQPYSVILFDEIEKAHIDFADILLQIIDAGRLTDSAGREVSFKNTVIMVTSNLSDYESYLKPELIGRFDSIINFLNLNLEVIEKLIARKLEDLNQKLIKDKFHFQLSPALTAKIGELGHDDRYGARPLNNAFNRLVIRPVSKFIMLPQNTPAYYKIDLEGTKVVFEKVSGLEIEYDQNKK